MEKRVDFKMKRQMTVFQFRKKRLKNDLCPPPGREVEKSRKFNTIDDLALLPWSKSRKVGKINKIDYLLDPPLLLEKSKTENLNKIDYLEPPPWLRSREVERIQ